MAKWHHGVLVSAAFVFAEWQRDKDEEAREALRWSLKHEYVLSQLPSRRRPPVLQTNVCHTAQDCYGDVVSFLSLSPRSRQNHVLSFFDGHDVYDYNSDTDSSYSDSDDDSFDD